ncbi:MAG TPA: PglZ domain-containing protein [Spirochaetota bacterium]|jgi:hypothetical protein|nr:PglZ domain-containing protein [Spirochaetota bacterium]
MDVEIIYDMTRKYNIQNGTVFEKDSDYFQAFEFVYNNIKTDNNIKIIVCSKSLKDWLIRFLDKYSNINVKSSDNTYKEFLSKKWNIHYDIDITDREIESDNLLSYDIEGYNNKSFSTFICELFISKYLVDNKINKNNIGLLINDLYLYQLNKSNMPFIVKKIFKHKIHELKRNNSDLINFIEYFDEGFIELYKIVSLYKIVLKYPIDFKRLFFDNIKWVKITNLEKLKYDDLNISQFKTFDYYETICDQIKIYIKSIIDNNAPDIALNKIIDYSSGEVRDEIDTIIRLLKENPELINKELIIKLQNKYNKILGHDIEKLNDLITYIKPVKPSEFSASDDIFKIINWAVKEYLPYKFWMENTRNYDNEILSYGKSFSEYFLLNYDKIKYHYENVINRYIFNNKELIAETDIPIILILDNFNYKYIDKLISEFEKYGYSCNNEKAYLSLLPSDTSIGKSAIVSGSLDIINNNYQQLFQSKWQQFFPNHKMKYISKLGELETYKPDEKEFILLNYLRIDEELHESFKRSAIEHKANISFILQELIKLITNFIKRNNIDNKTKVFFISDHGSTLICKDKVLNNIETKNYKNIDIEDISHRYLSVNEEIYNNLSNNKNIEQEIYTLSGIFNNNEKKNFIIAKAYNRFKEINEDFYVHGGALPEEVIIPSGFFYISTDSYKPVIITLLKNEYRLRVKETIIYKISNPNNIAINDVIIKIYNNNLLTEDVIIEIIGISETQKESEIRLNDKNYSKFNFDIEYCINGIKYNISKELEFTIKSILINKDNNFDF